MGGSANHHFVPQGVLRNFCFEGERLFYFSKRSPSKGVHGRNIASVFKRRQLNSYFHPDGSTSDEVEKFFAEKFDDRIVGFLRKYEAQVSERTNASISKDDHRFFVQCLYNLMKRTPEFHEPENISTKLEEIIPLVLLEYQEKNGKLSEEEISEVFPEEAKRRVIQNARVDVLKRQAPNILSMLDSMRVCFAFPARPQKAFIVGSQPVVRLTNDENMRLDTGNIELWTPLSPRIAVGLLRPNRRGNVFSLSDQLVRHINVQLYQNSSAVASHSEKLLKSIVHNGR